MNCLHSRGFPAFPDYQQTVLNNQEIEANRNKRPLPDAYYQETESTRINKKHNNETISPIFDLSEEEDTVMTPTENEKSDSFLNTTSSTNEIDDTDFSSEVEEICFTIDEFIKNIKIFSKLDNYQQRVEALWNSLPDFSNFETGETEGKCCWIAEPQSGTNSRSMLFRIYPGFKSTSISINAIPENERKNPWYNIEVLEYDDQKQQLKDSENDSPLLEMHLGAVSGIDWIGKGNFSGTEIKNMAMKICELGGLKQTLFDISKIPSGMGSEYSIRYIFSLIKGKERSWYERDGFIAMNSVKGSVLCFEETPIFQDNVAYYMALRYLREIKISHIYSVIIQGKYQQGKLLQAYKVCFNNRNKNDLLSDKKTDFSELVSLLWEKRSDNTKCRDLFDYIYFHFLNKNVKIFKDSSKDVIEWNKAIEIITSTNFFINPGNKDDKVLAELLNTLDNSNSQKKLRELGTL